MTLETWFEKGKKLPRPPREKKVESVAEVHRARETGERPALADESPMSEVLKRAEQASTHWKANRSI